MLVVFTAKNRGVSLALCMLQLVGVGLCLFDRGLVEYVSSISGLFCGTIQCLLLTVVVVCPIIHTHTHSPTC